MSVGAENVERCQRVRSRGVLDRHDDSQLQSPVLSQPLDNLMSSARESTAVGNAGERSALAADWLDGRLAVLRCCVGRNLCDIKQGVDVDCMSSNSDIRNVLCRHRHFLAFS